MIAKIALKALVIPGLHFAKGVAKGVEWWRDNSRLVMFAGVV